MQEQISGVIAAGNADTAQAGATILQQGGNAIDAAVAATFASFVSEIALVNIGGGGIATIFNARQQTSEYFDFFCDMPSRAYQDGVSDFQEVLIDFGSVLQPFFIGRASTAVPGVVAGLCHLLETHGSLPLKTVLKPAIDLAEGGFEVSGAIGYTAHLLRDILTHTPSLAAVFAPGGHLIQPKEHLRLPALGQSLRQIALNGANYFYRGALAADIVADQETNHGLLTADDLANYQVRRHPPLRIPYREYEVMLPGPASVGGVLIGFTLRLLATFDLSSQTHHHTRHLRILAEAMRLTNVARANLSMTPAGVAQFLSVEHVEQYQSQLRDIMAGATPPAEPKFVKGSNDTSHISVIDQAKNVCTITTSAGEGSGYVVGNTGLMLNNVLGEIDLHPNGFHQTPPGERLQTMMSPGMMLKDGRPMLVFGSGGSTRLRSAILQVIANVADFGLNFREAVNKPRIHFEEGVLQLEGGFADSTAAQLTAFGYKVNPWSTRNMYFGGVHIAGCEADELSGMGDARRGGCRRVVR